MSAEALRKDADELLRLAEMTESLNVKRILSNEAEKLKQVAEKEKLTASAGAEKSTTKVVRNAAITTKIVNYAWDQSDKFLKIYVSLNGVHDLPSENISTEYDSKLFELQILGTDKKNNVLTIKNLLFEIVPSESYHRVKTDMVILYLKKASSSQHWQYVTESEKKAKEPKTPRFDKEEPEANLMSLMKQMYEDGDDEMKRTIAKAWTEARDKSPDNKVL
jgi:calcyclin binding protein